MNLSNYKTQGLVVVIGLLWVVSNWGLSHLWGYGLAQGIAPTSLVMLVLWLYDRFLWKYPILKLLVKVPNLNGSYCGCVEYHFNGKDDSKDCTLKIQQTASYIKVRCEFKKEGESTTMSESKEAIFTQDEVNNYSLLFYYQNKGSHKSGDTLDQHDGLNVLNVDLSDSKKITLKGFYFTNRNPQTKGRMTLTKIEKGDK